jgi:hypothetical protein
MNNATIIGPREWCYTEDALFIGKSSGGISNTIVEPWAIHWDELLNFLRQPLISSKDGSYLVRCSCKDNHRANENAKTANLIILDGDSRLDPDTGEILNGAPEPSLVHEALTQLDITHCIYSSYSNQLNDKGNRYRVVIPAQYESQEDLKAGVNWIIHQFHAEGVLLNNVKENLTFTQGWYLPRCPDEKHLGLFQFMQHDGLQQFPMEEARQWWEQNQPKVPAAKVIEDSIPIRGIGRHEKDAPIFQFNKLVGAKGILKMLAEANYVFAGQTVVNDYPAWRFMHPQSTSRTPGVVLFKTNNRAWRVYSHHGDYDPLSGRAEDAFGLFTTLRHEGNFEVALDAAIEMLQEFDKAKQPTKTLVEALGEFAVEDCDVQGIGGAEHLYKKIIPKSQLVAIVAPPNAGKTAVFERLASNFPGQVDYINVDISAVHIPAAYARAKAGGYRLICPDLKKGGSIKKVMDILQAAADGGENLSDVVIIIDTLKKIMDMMSKKSVPMVMDLLRRLTTKGASVILLGHTNKYPDQEGWPVYEGVGDLRSDVDAMAVMIPYRRSKDIVLTSLYWLQDGWGYGKDRGPVEPASWLIDRADDRRVDELDEWVDTRALAMEGGRLVEESDQVADIHSYLMQHPEGVLKTELVTTMQGLPYQHSRRKIASLLDHYAGQYWDEIQQRENNAKLFKPIMGAVLPGTTKDV